MKVTGQMDILTRIINSRASTKDILGMGGGSQRQWKISFCFKEFAYLDSL